MNADFLKQKLKCYACDHDFKSIKQLEGHLKDAHPIENDRKSQISKHINDQLNTSTELEVIDIIEEEPTEIIPQTSKHPGLPENCTKTSKEEYVNQAVSQGKSTLPKNIIMEKSSSKSQTSNHENSLHHSSTPSEFTCYICHTIFLQEIGLMRHIERAHKSKNEDNLEQTAKIYRVDPDVSVYSSEVRIIHGLETTPKCTSNEVVLGI